MKIKKLVAATVLTVAATGITAATAYGSPEVSSETVLRGVDHGVQYTAAVAPDRSDATITLASGKFVLTPDAGISVLAPDGSVVATVPTTLQTVAGKQVQVSPEVDATATTLTLTPVNARAPQSAPLQYIGDAGTTVAGVLIGCAVGALIGLLFVVVGFLPGCVIGGIIGGIAGANQ